MYSKYQRDLREKRAVIRLRKEAGSVSPARAAANHSKSIESLDSFGSVSKSPARNRADNNDLRNRAEERVQKWMTKLQQDEQLLKGKNPELIFIQQSSSQSPVSSKALTSLTSGRATQSGTSRLDLGDRTTTASRRALMRLSRLLSVSRQTSSTPKSSLSSELPNPLTHRQRD